MESRETPGSTANGSYYYPKLYVSVSKWPKLTLIIYYVLTTTPNPLHEWFDEIFSTSHVILLLSP